MGRASSCFYSLGERPCSSKTKPTTPPTPPTRSVTDSLPTHGYQCLRKFPMEIPLLPRARARFSSENFFGKCCAGRLHHCPSICTCASPCRPWHDHHACGRLSRACPAIKQLLKSLPSRLALKRGTVQRRRSFQKPCKIVNGILNNTSFCNCLFVNHVEVGASVTHQTRE